MDIYFHKDLLMGPVLLLYDSCSWKLTKLCFSDLFVWEWDKAYPKTTDFLVQKFRDDFSFKWKIP